MAVATSVAVAGVAVSAYGAYSADKNAKAANAAQQDQYDAMNAANAPRSYGTQGVFGKTAFDADTGTLRGEWEGADKTAYNAFSGAIDRAAKFGDPRHEFMMRTAQDVGAGNIMGDYRDMRSESYTNPGYFDQYAAGNNAAQSILQSGAGYGAAHQGHAFAAGDQMYGQGQGLFQNAQNYDAFRDEKLATMRALDAPAQERRVDSLQQDLFSKGILGTEGGARSMQAFQEAEGQNDLRMIMASQDQAERLRMGDMQMGGSMMNSGLNAHQQGYQQLNQMGTLANQYDQLSNNMMQAGFGMEDRLYSRANMRMQDAQNLFGFGNDAYDASLGRIGAYQEAMQGMQNNARQNMALARSSTNPNIAYQAAPAGTGGNAWGAFAQGLGSSMMNYGGSMLGGNQQMNSMSSFGNMNTMTSQPTYMSGGAGSFSGGSANMMPAASTSSMMADPSMFTIAGA